MAEGLIYLLAYTAPKPRTSSFVEFFVTAGRVIDF
jgi:hypothetical protein